MAEDFKAMSVQEYSDLFTKLQEQDNKFGTVGELNKVFAQKLTELSQMQEAKFDTIGELNKVFAQKLTELLQMQEAKFDTVGEMHSIFAQKFAEYDTEIQTLRTRIAQLESK